MKKIKLLSGIMILLSLSTVFGQQDPQYTQYMYNQNVLNPAYAGSKGVLSLGLLGRTQWVGVDGAPQTLTLSMHAPIGNAVGLGLSVISDRIGPAKEDNLYADFSYTIPTSENGNLAFGLKAGFSFLNVRALEGLDTDVLLNEPVNQTSPNFGAGIFYYTQKFYAGLSVPNFLETRHIETTGGAVSTASEKMHYFFTTGYVFDINDDLKLKPSAMVKAAMGAPVSIDLSANALINDKIEFGLNYRLDDSVSAMIGVFVTEDMRIGYAYDYTTSNFGQFNSGSHEIMLLFDFNRRKIKSPRFF
ncbi:MAG: type IX secretion system membrane protein PorP/SprF [Flavobacteriaceae bacterium]|nr:type IX secretion system membrane protein PorP/SprF [Flavobacteriaceae bacterium]